jgi:protein-S-isoprenylcysteine O-methyltransferase Ste14
MSKSNLISLVVLVIAGAVALHAYWPAGPLAPVQVVSLVVMGASFCLFAVARIQLGGSFTVSAQAKQLVTHGIYSRIRNPIYVFGGLLVASVFMFVGRPLLLLVFVVLIPVQVVRARAESRALEQAFGDQYRAYKARTWF